MGGTQELGSIVLVAAVLGAARGANAQEPIDLGPALAVGDAIPGGSLAATDVVSNGEDFLVVLADDEDPRQPYVVRLVGHDGRVAGPLTCVGWLGGGGWPLAGAGWTGSAWVVVDSEGVFRLDPDGALIGWQPFPRRRGAVFVAGDGGGLALTSCGRSWCVVPLDANGVLGDEVAVELPPQFSRRLAWDGTRYLVVGAEGTATWINLDPEPRAAETAAIGRLSCIGGDGQGNLALGLGDEGRFRVVDARHELVATVDVPIFGRCDVESGPGGFRLFWDGATRLVDANGQWLDDETPLALFGPVARAGDAYLIAGTSGATVLDETGAPLDRPRPIGTDTTLNPTFGPFVAGTGSGFELLFSDSSDVGSAYYTALLRPDARLESPGVVPAGVSGASCNRLACADDEWCAAACYEQGGGGGQGGWGSPGGPAIGWLQQGSLVARVPVGGDGESISDIEWDGERFVVVVPGNPPNVQWASRDIPAVEETLMLDRAGLYCALATDADGVLVGCLATDVETGWIARIDTGGVLGAAQELPPLAHIDLAAGTGGAFATWIESDDPGRALRFAPLGLDGAVDPEPIVLAPDVSWAAIAPWGDGAAVALQQDGLLSIASLPAPEPVELQQVANVLPSDLPANGDFSLASSGRVLALGYRVVDPDGTGVRVSLAPGATNAACTPCVEDASCASAFCVDGVCCDVACDDVGDGCRERQTVGDCLDGRPDGGLLDAGAPDSGAPDSGAPEGGVSDAGAPDATHVLPTGPSDPGCGCHTSGRPVPPSAGVLGLVLVLGLRARRRPRARHRLELALAMAAVACSGDGAAEPATDAATDAAVDAPGGPTCGGAGLATCDGRCVDTASDPAHCGACETACGDAVCRASECVEACGDLVDCDGACVDLATSAAHCGRCDVACEPGELCEESECVVPVPSEWRVVYDDLAGGWLLSAWGSARDDVWFVGGGEGSLVIHWDGESFETVAAPSDALLWWVWGTRAGDLWIVGEAGTILRRDGDAFVPVDSPVADAVYYGIWGDSADELWIVGTVLDEASSARGILLRSRAGAPFEVVEPTQAETHGFFKVWGSADDDAWVVGERGTLLHFDGADWSDEDPGTDVRLFTVHGCATDDVWAVGGFGNGIIVHFDGAEWLDLSPRFAPLVNGVHCTSGVVRAVGASGYATTRLFGEWHEALPTRYDLHGIWGTGASFAFAVGGNLNSARTPAERRGALVHYGPETPVGNEL